jgi:DtxR family Mn-dependent transcriptional regulator
MQESESREMYLKSIYELANNDDLVPVSLLANRMGISPVSATEMVKRLEEHGLINHTPYKGLALTESGRQRALIVIRRQRLWGRFLADHLKIRWSQVYDMSCRLEHATDETVTEALAEFLGHPTICPHGHPIPSADGTVADQPATPLNKVDFELEVVVVRIDQPELTLCEHLEEKAIFPGTRLVVVDEAPYNGPFTLLLNGQEITLGREISSRVMVQRSDKNPLLIN